MIAANFTLVQKYQRRINHENIIKEQRTFLEIVDRVNHQVVASNASAENAIAWYDKEISPYGYPTHQSILMAEGMSMFHFNREIVKNQVKDKEGNLLLGEGFSDLSPRNTVLIITSQMI